MNHSYIGPERRKLLNLRRVIDDALPDQKSALAKMARMLGPDKLHEMDAVLPLASAWKPLTFEEVLGKLPAFEKQILEMRAQGKDYEKIGWYIGSSYRMILMMEHSALKLLKHRLRYCECVSKEVFEKYQRLFEAMGFREPPPRGLNCPPVMKGAGPMGQAELLDTGIDVIGLNTRLRHYCIDNGIATVRELVVKNEEDLLRLRNLGEATLIEIKEALAVYGLRLGMKI